MKKIAKILSVMLFATTLAGFGGVVEAKAETTGTSSSYTVAIPQSVGFGELSIEYDNTLDYALEVSYADQDNTPNVTVTSAETGVLTSSSGEYELTFDNSLFLAELTSTDTTKTGTLSVSASEVRSVREDDYKGSIEFTIALSSLVGDGSDDGSGDGSVDDSVGGGTVTEQTFKDGNYYVEMYLWHQYADQVSMGNCAFENNQKALVTFEDEEVTTVRVASNPVNISGIISALWDMYVNGVLVDDIERKSFTTSTSGYEFDYLAIGEFQMPSEAQPISTSDITYISDVEIVVPDTPMDSIYPDGIKARLRFNWSTLVSTSDGSIDQNSSLSSGTIDLSDYLTDEESVSDVTTTEGTSTVEIVAGGVQTDNTVSATISDDSMTAAIESVLETASEQGSVAEVKIAVSVTEETETISITFPDTSLQSLADSTGATLVIESDLGSIVLDQNAIQALVDQSENGSITFELSYSAENDVTEAMVAAAGEATLFSLKMLAGESYISDFNGGLVTVSVPFTLDDEYAEAVVVYHVDEDGVKTARETWVDVEDGRVYFETGSFSIYMVGLVEGEVVALGWENPFEDVEKSDWFYGAVGFVVENGLFSGTSETTFSPNADMTRSMLMSVLWRMVDCPVPYTRDYSYLDVKEDDYFHTAVRWGAENGIVAGYVNGLFGSEDSLTREQLVVFLHRMAQREDDYVAVEEELTGYNDIDQIEEYALEAFTWAVAEGIVSGVSEKTLAPKAKTTRAQVAKVLEVYVSNKMTTEIEETEEIEEIA